MDDNLHIPIPPIQSQLKLQISALLQKNLAGCNPPAISANISSSYQISSVIALYKELKKEKKAITTLLKDHKIRVQKAEQDILENDIIFIALGATAACLQEGGEKLKAENKSWILVQVGLFNMSKNIPFTASASRLKKIADSVTKHHLRLFMKVEVKLRPAWRRMSVS